MSININSSDTVRALSVERAAVTRAKAPVTWKNNREMQIEFIVLLAVQGIDWHGLVDNPDTAVAAQDAINNAFNGH